MKVIKRNGATVEFNRQKIIDAISKAGFVDGHTKKVIADTIENCGKEIITIESIQDMVEKELMATKYKNVAKNYVRYRYARELIRNNSGANNEILDIVNLKSQDAKDENSNKNPVINSTQRDYIAGTVSRDLSEKLLLPEDIVKAHREGLIHVHDTDYLIQKEFNCCLVNMEDILQNGTVINNTLIEKPHSFSVACNIATQVMAQIASNQYGGQSVSLTHLAPFVDISRKRIREQVLDDLRIANTEPDCRIVDVITEKRVKEEIKRGVQTMQYQINTLMTSNGQTPFVTLFMYLNEAPEGRTRDDLAMVIEEVVHQRYEGTKNEAGVFISPAFPKLIYVLQEDNIHEGDKYYYLTKLCARCSTKRLVPDYISEKMMLENKITDDGVGHCYPCMGCRSFLTPYLDQNSKAKFYGRLTA